jgi:hypothetical protein
MKPILCTLFALPLVCAPLARAQTGQSTTGTFFQGTGPLRNVVSGNFRGAVSRDAVLLQGQSLWYLTRPSEIRSMAAITIPGVTSVTGMVAFQRHEDVAGWASLPVATGQGLAGHALCEPDNLLVTTSSGTFLGEFSNAAQGFTFTSTLNSRWTGATMLTAARDPGTTRIRIAGRGPDNALLLASRESNGMLMPRGAIVLPSPILELVWVDWDNDGDIDCAVTTASGLLVTTSTGAGLFSSPLAFSAMRSTAAVSGNAAVHVCVTDTMTSPSFGRIQSNAAGWLPLPLDTFGLTPAQQTPICLRAYDVGGDGQSEYVLMRSGSFRGVYSDGQGDTEFNLLPSVVGNPAQSLCPFLWEDLNGDQKPDGLFFLDAVQPQMAFLHSLYRRPLPSGEFTLAPPNFNENDPSLNLSTVKEVIAEATYYGATNDELNGRLELRIGRALAGAATHFDVVVWHQGDPLNAPYLDRVPVFNARYVVPPGTDTFPVYFQLLPQIFNTYYWPNHDHYYLDLRFVDVPHNKVVYGETDGLSLYPYHPSDIESEEAALYYTTFYYLSHRDHVPGQSVTQIGILYPHVDLPDDTYGSHTDVGEIFTRILPPNLDPGYVPL